MFRESRRFRPETAPGRVFVALGRKLFHRSENGASWCLRGENGDVKRNWPQPTTGRPGVAFVAESFILPEENASLLVLVLLSCISSRPGAALGRGRPLVAESIHRKRMLRGLRGRRWCGWRCQLGLYVFVSVGDEAFCRGPPAGQFIGFEVSVIEIPVQLVCRGEFGFPLF